MLYVIFSKFHNDTNLTLLYKKSQISKKNITMRLIKEHMIE